MTRKNNNFHDEINPYREALQIILNEHPNGLSSVQIANYLAISDFECEALLKSEQLRNSIDVDFSTENLLYKSQVNSRLNISFDEAMLIAKKRKSLSLFKTRIKILASTLVSFALTINFSGNIFHINIFSPLGNSSPNKNLGDNKGVIYTDSSIQERIEAEVSRENKQKLELEENDLLKRISKMESIATQLSCNVYWRKNQSCYIEGRLLDKLQFEKEINQMKFRISQIRELLDIYTKQSSGL